MARLANPCITVILLPQRPYGVDEYVAVGWDSGQDDSIADKSAALGLSLVGEAQKTYE